MEIECPGCATRYAVPDGALAAGQATRCARCGDTWTPVAEEAAAAPPRPSEPQPQAEMPQPQAEMPQPQAAMPQPQAEMPQPQAAMPQPQAAMPQPQAAMPQPQAAMPQPKAFAPAPPVLAATEPLAAGRSRMAGAALAGGWVATALVLVGLGWAAIHFRPAIEVAWPPSTRLYGLFDG